MNHLKVKLQAVFYLLLADTYILCTNRKWLLKGSDSLETIRSMQNIAEQIVTALNEREQELMLEQR